MYYSPSNIAYSPRARARSSHLVNKHKVCSCAMFYSTQNHICSTSKEVWVTALIPHLSVLEPEHDPSLVHIYCSTYSSSHNSPAYTALAYSICSYSNIAYGPRARARHNSSSNSNNSHSSHNSNNSNSTNPTTTTTTSTTTTTTTIMLLISTVIS